MKQLAVSDIFQKTGKMHWQSTLFHEYVPLLEVIHIKDTSQ
jgi:hypothetical protein